MREKAPSSATPASWNFRLSLARRSSKLASRGTLTRTIISESAWIALIWAVPELEGLTSNDGEKGVGGTEAIGDSISLDP